MVPILMLNKKRSATQNLQGTHSTHAKYVINHSIHILQDLVVLSSGIRPTTHSLCMIRPATTYYSPISSKVAAIDYPKIKDADWSIQILF